MTTESAPSMSWLVSFIVAAVPTVIVWAKFRADTARNLGVITSHAESTDVRLAKVEKEKREDAKELHARIDALKEVQAAAAVEAAAHYAASLSSINSMRSDIGEIKTLLTSAISSALRDSASDEFQRRRH